jgi:hypothetical protein
VALEISAREAIRRDRHRESFSRLWMLAKMMRAKSIPPLDVLIKEPKRAQTWQEMRAIMHGIAGVTYERGSHRPQGSESRAQTVT